VRTAGWPGSRVSWLFFGRGLVLVVSVYPSHPDEPNLGPDDGGMGRMTGANMEVGIEPLTGMLLDSDHDPGKKFNVHYYKLS